MVQVIIISFEYTENRLLGSIFDLYKVYSHFKKLNYNIHIYTDIIYNYIYFDYKYLDNIKNKNNRIRDFIDLICRQTTEPYNKYNFLKKIKNDIIKDDKYFIYYSGHGIDGKLLLPSFEKIDFNDFIYEIIKSIKDYSQIFILLDCCKIGDVHMTFKFDNKILKYHYDIYYPHCIYIMTTSSSNEDSLSTQNGSLFTKYFFKEHKIYEFNYIIEYIQNEIIMDALNIKNKIEIPTISIYCSYINHPILWLWIFIDNLNIIPDYSLSNIYLQLN